MKKSVWLIAGGVLLLAVGAVFWLLPDGSQESQDESEKTLRSRRIREEVRQRDPKKAIRRNKGGVPVKPQVAHEKPVIDLSDAEVKQLDELQKKVLSELSDALDGNDFASVRRALSKMRKLGLERARKEGNDDWMKYVSRTLRAKAISALGWFGEAALPELAEFLAEPDPELMQDAMSQFELAMEDFTMGDIAKGAIIKQVCSTITDEDMTEWMMMEAINARNSVGIDTLTYIYQNGTPMAKSKVFEYLEFFTGEEMQNIEQASQWLSENPGDPEFDEEMWGPIKD